MPILPFDSMLFCLALFLVQLISLAGFLHQAYLPTHSFMHGFDLSIFPYISTSSDGGIFVDTTPNPMPLIIEDSSMGEGLHEDQIRRCVREKKHVVDVCCICLGNYVDGDDVGVLNCSHEFHTNYIKQWLLQKNRCPICQRKAFES
ncbi:RING-H2 finger protein ATL66-like [Salvia hispanica]|uniref:RING-H2 finger protein ATL66-like n=1 Tax=Salvia hispanica TaxID=49212 RepID=UPI0020091563|nr:RING-H2 finger protein ATL66-like [Salvia hispanica]